MRSLSQAAVSGGPVRMLGRFTVQSEIGRGAMGVVYRGIHPGLDVPVAIKVLSDIYSRDASFRQRFQREASTIASLNHPGIVRVYDFDEDQGSLFIVMEFVEGRSLRQWLEECGRFTIDTSLDLIQQLLSGVGAAHAHGIVHRDLKPENVLISKQGKTKILDFGVSKLLDESTRLTGTGSMVGTPSYMSPEQVRSAHVDSRSDVYALGAMLYELLHGQPPFTGPVPAVLHAQVYEQARASTAIPEELMELIWKALAKDPAHRFRSCEELSGALLSLPSRNERLTEPPATAPVSQKSASKGLGSLIGKITPVVTRHEQATCMHRGCDTREGWQCQYQDAAGRRCESWWCKRHIEFVENIPFCHRHGSVIRALKITAGTIREIKTLPAVDDRSLPLAALIGQDVDRDVMELLRRRFQGRKDITLVRDRTIREVLFGRNEIAWERSWAALKSNGYVTRIAIRVPAKEPPEVQVLIGNTVVFEAIPDWILRRLQGGPPDPADRANFRSKVVKAVQESVDQPTPFPALRQVRTPEPSLPRAPQISLRLLEGLVLRIFSNNVRMTGYEVAAELALPFANVEPVIEQLTAQHLLDAQGISSEDGVWKARPLPERMVYSASNRGRERAEEISRQGTRYVGPAPVSMEEYRTTVSAAAEPLQLDQAKVDEALDGLELAPGIPESLRAAVNSRSSVFIYGSPGNGKTSLARRLVRLLGGPILVPVALDLEGEVLRVFDPAVHHLDGPQPADKRWRRVSRPLVQVGGEFQLDMLDPTWDEASRTYEAPLGVKANGGVLLLDDLGRQRVTPKQIMDRLLVPLEQKIDYLNLAGSGRKVEIPFLPLVALSTNMSPNDLLDEAYLRRLSYKILMPDPSWEGYQRIFERECRRLGITPEPNAIKLIEHFYGARPKRGNHPRDLLERLVDVSAARRVQPQLNPQLIEAAWQTLFVTG